MAIPGVTVHFKEFDEPRKVDGDYMVCAIPFAILRKIAMSPAWPESKQFVFQNTSFGNQSRVLLQSRTPFWKGDLPSINLETGESAMYLVYETADEVPGDRSILMGSGSPDVTAEQALGAFTKVYPGKSHTIEQAYVHNWSKDPWAFNCERHPFPLGSLKKRFTGRTSSNPSAGSTSPAATPTTSPGAWTPPPARPTELPRSSMRRDRPNRCSSATQLAAAAQQNGRSARRSAAAVG